MSRGSSLFMAFRCSTKLLLSPPSRVSSIRSPFRVLSRQMSVNARSVVDRLRNSGLLQTQVLIGGKWTDAYDGKTIQVNNPATDEVIADVSCVGARETNDAISAAYDAFKSWSKLTAAERSKCLRKWYDLVIAHKEELGQLITLEQGKPLKEAIGEVISIS